MIGCIDSPTAISLCVWPKALFWLYLVRGISKPNRYYHSFPPRFSLVSVAPLLIYYSFLTAFSMAPSAKAVYIGAHPAPRTSPLPDYSTTPSQTYLSPLLVDPALFSASLIPTSCSLRSVSPTAVRSTDSMHTWLPNTPVSSHWLQIELCHYLLM